MTYKEERMESMKYRDSTGREPAGSSCVPEAERARRGQLVGLRQPLKSLLGSSKIVLKVRGH